MAIKSPWSTLRVKKRNGGAGSSACRCGVQRVIIFVGSGSISIMGEFGEAMNTAEKPELVPGSGEVDPFGG